MGRKYLFFFKKSQRFFKKPLVMAAGRNNQGRITVNHQGGGDKHSILLVDRFRFLNAFGFVLRILDDFFRTAYVGLIIYDNGLLNFILLCEGVLKGSLIFSGARRIFNASVGSTQNYFL